MIDQFLILAIIVIIYLDASCIARLVSQWILSSIQRFIHKDRIYTHRI